MAAGERQTPRDRQEPTAWPSHSDGERATQLRRCVRRSHPAVAIDWDILLAGALCHDVGKPYEFDPTNRSRWQAAPGDSGSPTFRHSVFGMHVCLAVGLPEEVAHIAVGHSFEGRYMGVSAECTIVRQADHAWWHLAGCLGLVTPESVGVLSANLRVRESR